MMTIDYALIRLSLWLANLQPPDLEWLIAASIALATPLTLVVAAVYVVRTVRARGSRAITGRMPTLIAAAVGIWTLSPIVTTAIVCLADIVVFSLVGTALEAINRALPIAWRIWYALGGAR